MTIKGLVINEGFPRLGKLKKGDKKKTVSKNGRTYETFGDDLEWFRFATEREDVFNAFVNAYGNQPDSFEVLLPFSTPSDNFRYGREYYRAGGLDFECDGENMILWRGDDGMMHTDPKPCPYCSGQIERTKKDPGCVQYGKLSVLLPGLLEAGYVGHVDIETHSWNDIKSILGSLQYTFNHWRADHPLGLRGIVWKVYRIPQKISTPMSFDNRRQRARREKWLVKIEPAAGWVQAQLAAAKEAALLPDPMMARRFERDAMLRLESGAAEIRTTSGQYVNAVHLAADPAGEEDTGPTERDLIPPSYPRANGLFKTTGNGRKTEPTPEPEDFEEGEYEEAPGAEPEAEAPQGSQPLMAGMPEREPEVLSWIDNPPAQRKFGAKLQALYRQYKIKELSKDELRLACKGRVHDTPDMETALQMVETYLQTVAKPRNGNQAELPGVVEK